MDDKYHSLKLVLDGAYQQASRGKGRERHADGEPFERQKICTIARWVQGSPAAGPLQQVIKKAAESARLPLDSAIHELYGVINYAAAAIIVLENSLIDPNDGPRCTDATDDCDCHLGTIRGPGCV